MIMKSNWYSALNMSLKVAISNAGSFADLKPLVDGVVSHLTFWGGRYITTPNYEGTASIDVLALQVIKLANQYKFRFTNNERQDGKIIADRITQLYDIRDTQIEQSCFLTRIFVFFRNLISNRTFYECPAIDCSEIRWRWDRGDIDCNCIPTYSHVFDFYTRDQYYCLWHFCRTPATLKFSHTNPERPAERIDTWLK
jgi:hypothetical protein